MKNTSPFLPIVISFGCSNDTVVASLLSPTKALPPLPAMVVIIPLSLLTLIDREANEIL